jgi:glycosyltransferase involved in cell wall biosynthesis
MKPDINVCIVIPCYNEEKGFLLEEYSSFIEKHHNVLLCFVNDGSTDNTLKILTRFKKKYSQKVEIVSYEKNKGKAEAVRIGVLYCNDRYEHKYVAFLDADLSTSLQECVSLTLNE